MRGGGFGPPPLRLSRTLPPAAACHGLSQPGPAGHSEAPVTAGVPQTEPAGHCMRRRPRGPAAGPASPG